ncbi:TetR family transcriptional regulator, partial [Shigella sonnei]
KLIVGLQYIAKIPRQQALLKILYHKCEFNDGMLAEGVIREKMGFNPQTLREVLQACQQQGCVANNLDLDVVMIIIDGAFSGIVQNWLMKFAQHGVSKTTFNDIADAANVTRGAIYWHFENKTQLFNEMWLQQPSLRELIQEHLTAGLEHDPFQQLR